MTPSFDKEVAGAIITFQPSDIHEYKDDPWDIRISIGNAPLDEAYYFTVNDPKAVTKSIHDLLKTYALNPDLADELDIENYPELPFLQEELLQYYSNHENGLLKLQFFINKNPSTTPVDVRQTAERFISVCTYDDESEDYCVLDLILVPEVQDTAAFGIDKDRREYGDVYLLLLIDYYEQKGTEAFEAFKDVALSDSIATTDGVKIGHEFRYGLSRLESNQFIEQPFLSGLPEMGARRRDLKVTDKGRAKIEELKAETQSLSDTYEPFGSVAVSPAALGVPDGFDARVQMMEYDRYDCKQGVLLMILDAEEDTIFTETDWESLYDKGELFAQVNDALSYKTNFSMEVLEALKLRAGEPE